MLPYDHSQHILYRHKQQCQSICRLNGINSYRRRYQKRIGQSPLPVFLTAGGSGNGTSLRFMDRSGAIDGHHASHMMQRIMELHMTSERFVCEDMGSDEKYIRK